MSMQIIDNLKIAPQRMRKDEMKFYEFFECDYCESICQMPIEQYKSYSEDEILNAKYRCERCVKPLEQKKRGRPPQNKTQKSNSLRMDGLRVNPPIQPAVNQQVTTDFVNKPLHYTSSKIECIDAIMSAVQGLDPEEAVHVANVMKYVWRFKRKDGKRDLQKAEWYLQRLIELQGE